MKTIPAAITAGLALSFSTIAVGASPGDLDMSFDSGSRLYGTVNAIAVQADGQVLVGGGFATVPGAVRRNLARLLADGSADPAFLNGMAGPDAQIHTIAVQRDGKILIGGVFHSVHGIPRTALARLTAEGSLDETFPDVLAGPDPYAYVSMIAVVEDGRIVISGLFTNVSGQTRPGLARLLPNGNLDTSFLNGLPGPYSPIGGPVNVAVQRDGKVLIAGMFTSVNGTARTNLARLNFDGTLDPAFLDGMAGPNELASVLGLQSDGRIVIGGYFDAVNGVPCGRIARLNEDGSTDTTFLQGQSGVNFSVYHLFIQSDDKILIGGNFTAVNGATRNRLARLNADGSLDSGFLNGMIGADNNVGPFAAQPDGRVVIGGSFERFNDVPGLRGFARLNADGAVDASFFHDPTGPDGSLYSLVRQADGKVVIGGVFRSVNNIPYSCIARLHPDGALDRSFSNTSGLSDSIYGLVLQSDGKLLAWGRYFNLARVNSDGTRDAGFLKSLAGPNRRPQCLAVEPNGRILIGGQFTTVNGVARNGIARLNSNGSLDTSHTAAVAGDLENVSVIALQSDGKALIGGQFTTVNGSKRPYLARLNTNGSLDDTFLRGMAGPNGGPGCIVVQTDERIVIWGSFTLINGVARPGLVRLNADGSVDNTFLNGLSGANGTIFSMLLQDDGKILMGGGFTQVNGIARRGLARLNADGSLDDTFQTGASGVNGYILSFAAQPDGNILIGGQFTWVNGMAHNFVARLIGGSLPTLWDEPPSRTAELGSDVRFRARAAGFPLPACQWYCEDRLLPDGTNEFLHFSGLQFTNAGTYSIVASNAVGSVTSAPVKLSVIAPIERRPVAGIRLIGTPATTFNLECTHAIGDLATWTPLDSVVLDHQPQWWFDLSPVTQPGRFYRASQVVPARVIPMLDLHLIPAVTLTGTLGASIRVEGINAFGPTDAWFLLDTVTLTNTSQHYFDVTAPGQPPRLYRLVPGP